MQKEGVEAQAAWRMQTKEPELLFGLASVDFATLEHTEKLEGEAGGFLLVGGKTACAFLVGLPFTCTPGTPVSGPFSTR